MVDEPSARDRSTSPWNLLLIIPFIATLWVPFFNNSEPSLSGIPFFYWYLFLWIVISSVITAFVYFATK